MCSLDSLMSAQRWKGMDGRQTTDCDPLLHLSQHPALAHLNYKPLFDEGYVEYLPFYFTATLCNDFHKLTSNCVPHAMMVTKAHWQDFDFRSRN